MSQEFNHIDDLFEDLNRFEGNASEQDWQAVLRKMQQEKLPVDTVFSRGFETFESNATDADWSAIQARMDKHKRRSVIWYVILPLALLMTAFATWSVLSDTDKSIAAVPAVSAAGQNNKAEPKEIIPNDKALPSSEATDHADAGNAANYTSPAIASNTVKNSPVSKQAASAANPAAANKPGTTMPVKQSGVNNAANSAQSTKPLATPAVKHTEENKIVSSDKTEEVSVPEIKEPEIPAIIDTAEHTKAVANTADSAAKKNNKDASAPDKSVFSPAKWRLALNAGVNNTFRTLSGTGGLYDSVRREQESPRLLASFGVNLDYAVNSHWIAGTGVQYNQYGQSANYEYRRRIYDSIPHMDTQGNIIGWFRLNYRDTVENSSQQLVYRYISVPLSVQYRFKLNSKLTGFAGAAATVNVFAGAKGRVIQMEQLMGVEDINRMRGKLRDITVSMLLSAGAEYRLNQRFSLGIAMTYMQGAQSYFKQSYPVKERPKSMGLNASLIFHLPNRNIAKPPVSTPKL